MESRALPDGNYFLGMHGQQHYPRWMYHRVHNPIIVSDTRAEEEAKARGFEAAHGYMTSNNTLQMWFWDLEDMSAKQLSVFAKDEYGVDLPIAAGQEKLFLAVCDLSRHAPQNQGRMVLMAHTINMNLQETMNQIRRGIAGGVTETITEEFVA